MRAETVRVFFTWKVLLVALIFLPLSSNSVLASDRRDSSKCTGHSCNTTTNLDINESSAKASATATGGSQSLTLQNPDNIKIRNVPTTAAPDVYPTVPCFNPKTGALGLTAFGLSMGGGKVDPGCERREMVRLANTLGMIERAVYLWCSDPSSIAAFGSLEECLMFEITSVPPSTSGVMYAQLSVEEEQKLKTIQDQNTKQQATIDELRRRLRAAESEVQQQSKQYQQIETREQLKRQRLEALLETSDEQ